MNFEDPSFIVNRLMFLHLEYSLVYSLLLSNHLPGLQVFMFQFDSVLIVKRFIHLGFPMSLAHLLLLVHYHQSIVVHLSLLQTLTQALIQFLHFMFPLAGAVIHLTLQEALIVLPALQHLILLNQYLCLLLSNRS